MNTKKIDGRPVRIDSGIISGTTTGRDNSISVYRGIPFAAPPVGNLRWKPPAPVEPWKGIRPAGKFGPVAPQHPYYFGGVNKDVWMSEDCLYLNVWTPAISPDEKLPVMVWIHGGAFSIGSGSKPEYNGVNLVENGVVLVTINYRLNFFGAFAHPLLTEESGHNASGNYCLMDQAAALEWVQRNITQFGGDPGCVTIFGESAGSRSVALLMVSPLSGGLFHRGICQSGATRDVSQSLEEREKESIKVADALGAKTLDDLRSVTYDEFASTGPFNANPFVDGRVIPDDPMELYAGGKQHNVPLIIGANHDEATFRLADSKVKAVEDYEEWMQKFYGKNADKILEVYPAGKDDDVYNAMNRYGTDTFMTLHARKHCRWMDNVEAHAYRYHFTRVPPTTGGNHLGSHHGAEIPYVFGNIGHNWGEATDIDRKLSMAMMTYWCRFAASGDPNIEGLPEWPVYKTESDMHIEFGDKVKAGNNLRKRELDVLEKFLK